MIRIGFQNCIEQCFTCATACQQCISDCLQETELQMLTACINLNRECLLICSANAQLMAIAGSNAHALCQTCYEICLACAMECERHVKMEHCQLCAEECRKCASACSERMEQAGLENRLN